MGAMSMRDALASYKGQRVLITGHTGFKGSWLTLVLKEIGATIKGCALPPIGARNHFDMLGLAGEIDHTIVDIRDETALSAAFESFQPQVVFHLAAQALVRESYDQPVVTFGTNVLGSVNVLEAVRNCPSVRALVYITSDKCYENFEWVWGYRETDQLGGHDPYSASKAAAELAFSAYDRSFFRLRPGFGAATARAGNVIGGGDWAKDRIVPDCVRAVEGGTRLTLRHPNATRPWQHVLEPVGGYLLLGANVGSEPARFGGSWNFGPSAANVRTVREVAETVSATLGGAPPEIAASSPARHEAGLLQLNCDKANQLLGWFPRWSADTTLQTTATWYDEVLKGADPRSVTRRQIHAYFEELS